ncbi:ankyrin repeat-containing domain protein [Phaeosphaeria sp. MPI-PUGE-AT-0046c]|nr:ankyrin repeat-containing domain protein [Phaeosphaeria sp. MPI-PUGE-AT-0046c]
MAEPLSAGLGILKSSWQAIEFARTTFHARDDAKRLYEKVTHLYVLIEKIDSIIQQHDEAFDKDIVLFVQNALEASNRTLDELARRCYKLGDKEDLTLFVRLPGSISYTLSAPTIQKFEQQVQTGIISVQLALELLLLVKNAIDRNAHPSSSVQEEVVARSDGSSTILEPSGSFLDISAESFAGHGLSPSTSMQTGSTSTNEIPGSPMELLTSQETRAWGEVQQPSEGSNLERMRIKPADSTALIAAINEHSLDRFQQLLDEGVNINGTDDKGFNPLMHTICQHSDTCVDCMHYMHKLLELRCDVDASVNGVTALHMAVRNESLDAAKVLLEKGASIDSSSPRTPLLLAIRHNRAAFVDLFVTNGADIHVADESRWSLIHHAVWQRSTEALLILLERNKTMDLGINLDAQSSVDWTPLMILAERAQLPQDVQLARMLLRNGADVNAVDGSGNPALYYSIKLHSASPQRNNFIHFMVEENKADKQLLEAKVLKLAMGRYSALRSRPNTQNV